MTAHGRVDTAFRFPESFSEAQFSKINEKAIPINKKKANKFGFSVLQYKILLLNIILRVNFTRKTEIVDQCAYLGKTARSFNIGPDEHFGPKMSSSGPILNSSGPILNSSGPIIIHRARY